MVSSCCAYGCTYRHKKEDKIGMYRFPKDEVLRQLWIVAVRRANWEPSPSTRICGKHFQSGRPSKDKNHPDYVPNVFVFTKTKKKILPPVETKVVIDEMEVRRIEENINAISSKAYRRLKPKLVNENDKQTAEVSNNNEKNNEMRPLSPQLVYIPKFLSEMKKPDVSNEKPKDDENESASPADKDVTVSDSIAETPVSATENTESPVIAKKKTVTFSVDTLKDTLTNAAKDILDHLPLTTIDDDAEYTSDTAFLNFKPDPFDTQEILKIKLETMLAVNISLQQKVKFYRRKCRLYEKQIGKLRNKVRRMRMKN